MSKILEPPLEINALDQAEKILSMCENYKKRNRLNKQISRMARLQKSKFKKMAVYIEEAQDMKYTDIIEN
jgi:hypothetical protein